MLACTATIFHSTCGKNRSNERAQATGGVVVRLELDELQYHSLASLEAMHAQRRLLHPSTTPAHQISQ